MRLRESESESQKLMYNSTTHKRELACLLQIGMKSAGSWNYFIIICLCFSLTPSLHVWLNNFSWHKLENFHHRLSASMKRYKSLFLLHFIWAFLRFYYSNFKFDKLFPSLNTCRIVTMTRATINNHHHSHSYIVCSENCWSVAPQEPL